MTQTYVSDELSHFVGRALRTDDERYELLLKILREGWLLHPPFDPRIAGNMGVHRDKRISDNEMYIPQVVCFCDIPVGDLAGHADKYSPFGLSFARSFLVGKGANPVFYVSRDTPLRQLLTLSDGADEPAYLSHALRGATTWGEHFDDMALRFEDGYWEDLKRSTDSSELASRHDFLTFYFFAYVKAFDASLRDDDPDNYYMEREWRVVGNVPFTITDVTRVFVTEQYRARLATDLPEYEGPISVIERAISRPRRRQPAESGSTRRRFQAAWDDLARADGQLATIRAAVGSHDPGSVYSIPLRRRYDSETRVIMWTIQSVPDVPERVERLASGAIDDLRSSLDLAWQEVCKDRAPSMPRGDDDPDLRFPLRDPGEAFDRQRCAASVGRRLADAIAFFQPAKAWEPLPTLTSDLHPLGALRHLSNKSSGDELAIRIILYQLTVGAPESARFIDCRPEVRPYEGTSSTAVVSHVGGPLSVDDEVLSFFVEPTGSHPDVMWDPVMTGILGVETNWALMSTLNGIADQIAEILRTFVRIVEPR